MATQYIYANKEQVQAAIEGLSTSDYALLCEKANLYISGTIFSENQDLVHEALSRCITGQRNWPIKVPFTTFLINSMRSIVSAERRSSINKNTRTESDYEALGHDPLAILGPWTISAEEEYLQRERESELIDLKNKIKSEFFDDPQAQLIIDSWGLDLTPTDVMSRLGCMRNEYLAAAARVDRKIRIHRRRRLK